MTTSVTQNSHSTPPFIPRKENFYQKYTFLIFLSSTAENANTDNWKLALNNWQHLKKKDIKLPEIIDQLFSRYEEDINTMDQFIKECEAHAFEIKKAYEVEKPKAARQLTYEEL